MVSATIDRLGNCLAEQDLGRPFQRASRLLDDEVAV